MNALPAERYMKKNRIIDIVECYGMTVDPSEDINFVDAMDIITESKSKMEMVGTGYLYGYMRGSRRRSNGMRQVPVCNLKQMTDEEWNELARKNRESMQRTNVQKMI